MQPTLEPHTRNGTRPQRLFVALWPPLQVVAGLNSQVQWARRRLAQAAGSTQPIDRLRWIEPEQWHLTLVFLGTVPAATSADLMGRLAAVAARHPPATMRFRGGGCFGNRVIYADVADGRDRITRLATSARAAARRCGIAITGGRSQPHVTLARYRPLARSADARRLDLQLVVQALADLDGPSWTAEALSLMRSELNAGPHHRSVYTEVAHWPLTG